METLTVSVADDPGAMLPVRTVRLGVCTASACVIAPVFLTVIVIVPVLATFALAGVILNSVSESVRLLPVAAGAAELAVVAGPLLELLLLLLLDEPHPASAATTTNGTSDAIRGIVVLVTLPAGRSFPARLVNACSRDQ